MDRRLPHLDLGPPGGHPAPRGVHLLPGPGDLDKNLRRDLPEGYGVRHCAQELLAVQDLHRGEDRLHDDLVRPRDGVHLLRAGDGADQQ